MLPPDRLARTVKTALIGQVRAIFNDTNRGEAPVMRSDRALFTPADAIWRVHGDVTTMMVGGVAALLLQMLHPAALAGIWDHSNFRTDMLGRLRRTARFIAVTTYGAREQAEASIAKVRAVHDRVRGVLTDGTAYEASDPHLLAWVHVTEMHCFLAAWRRYGEPGMPGVDQDRYFAEAARIGEALGADPVPRSRADADALIASMRGELVSDARTREVARMILSQPAPKRVMQPAQALTFQAAVDLLPDWARRMHGLPDPVLARPIVRAGTLGIARTLRWAFR